MKEIQHNMTMNQSGMYCPIIGTSTTFGVSLISSLYENACDLKSVLGRRQNEKTYVTMYKAFPMSPSNSVAVKSSLGLQYQLLSAKLQ